MPRTTTDPIPDLTTQGDGCLKGRSRDAVAHDATEEELAETTFIAAALRAGGAVVHGTKALNSIARA